MENLIKCPQCSHQFPVENALFQQAEEKIRTEYDKKLAEQSALFNSQQEALKQEKILFEQNKAKENEIFQQRLNKKIDEERLLLSKKNEQAISDKLKELESEKLKIKKKTQEEFELKMKMLQEEVEAKKSENSKLRQMEVEFLKKKP